MKCKGCLGQFSINRALWVIWYLMLHLLLWFLIHVASILQLQVLSLVKIYACHLLYHIWDIDLFWLLPSAPSCWGFGLLEYDALSLGQEFPTSQMYTLSSSSWVKWSMMVILHVPLDLWRGREHIPLKCQEPLIQWHSVFFQRTRIFNYIPVKNLKLEPSSCSALLLEFYSYM